MLILAPLEPQKARLAYPLLKWLKFLNPLLLTSESPFSLNTCCLSVSSVLKFLGLGNWHLWYLQNSQLLTGLFIQVLWLILPILVKTFQYAIAFLPQNYLPAFRGSHFTRFERINNAALKYTCPCDEHLCHLKISRLCCGPVLTPKPHNSVLLKVDLWKTPQLFASLKRHFATSALLWASS